MTGSYFIPGEWNFVCDICGRKRKSGEMRRGWGANLEAVVCSEHYQPQQPQDFVRVLPDDQSVPVARPFLYADAVWWVNNANQVVPWANHAGALEWTP